MVKGCYLTYAVHSKIDCDRLWRIAKFWLNLDLNFRLRMFCIKLNIFQSKKWANLLRKSFIPNELRQPWINFHTASNPSEHKTPVKNLFLMEFKHCSNPNNILTSTWSVQPREVLGPTSLISTLIRISHSWFCDNKRSGMSCITTGGASLICSLFSTLLYLQKP